ncbi:MAG TPA: glycoside hydrolase family 2, partial [Dyadobacter sp.]|nr:glycoside hydrolase family 2 [Dyadobacter sp.]
MMSRILYLFLLSTLFSLSATAQESLSLAGEWEVAFDIDDAGSHRMLKRRMPHKIQLPGTTDQAGLGEALKTKPELNRESLYQLARKHRFVGTAWYRRKITIPENWKGKQIKLNLERVLWL